MPNFKKPLKGVLVKDGTFTPMVIEDELETFYQLLDVRCIDTVVTEVDGMPVEIVCDDEALLKEHPQVTAINHKPEAALFGSLFVCGVADSAGELTSLTDEQCERVMWSVTTVIIQSTITRKTTKRNVLVTTYGDNYNG